MKKMIWAAAIAVMAVVGANAQVVVNPDGTHSVVSGKVVVNPDGTHSAISGNVIVNPDGTHSVVQPGFRRPRQRTGRPERRRDAAEFTQRAQDFEYGDMRPFEFEAGFGVAAGNRPDGTKATPGAALYIEGRYNIRGTPFDVGLQGLLSYFDRDRVMVGGRRLDMHIMPRLVTFYGDYNFGQWRRVSLFGGLGAGYAHVINQRQGDTRPGETGFGIGNTVRDNFFAVTPRVGVEFFHRVRLSIDYKIISRDYSCLGVNLGFVFGGGARK